MSQSSLPLFSSLQLTQMLCARVCHDMVSPLSAINSGLELLSESASSDNTEILDLLTHSARAATRRLVMMRTAFGSGAGGSCLNDLADLAAQGVDPEKFTLIWSLPPQCLAAHPDLHNWARLSINLLMLAVESAPYGGTIGIIAAPGNKFQMTLNLEGPTVVVHEEVRQTLQEPLQGMPESPRVAQAFWTRTILGALGRGIQIDVSGKTQLRFYTYSIV